MELPNYNQLRSFWAVARHGSVARASEILDLTQPTISKQIADLEDAFDESLFHRTGRRLVLTDSGKTVLAYADDIFATSRELIAAMRGQATSRPLHLVVGIADSLPKLLTRMLIEPAFQLDRPINLTCREGKTIDLLADLSRAAYDVVLADEPPKPGSHIRAFAHPLGSSPATLFAPAHLALELFADLPDSIDGIPLLVPTVGTPLRNQIDNWLESSGRSPTIIAEIDDSALLKTFAAAGHACFFAPTIIKVEIGARYHVLPIIEIPQITESVYAITLDRRTDHPAVAQIINSSSSILDR